MQFPPRRPESQFPPATRRLRTDAPVRSTRAARRPPSRLSRCAPCAGLRARSPHRRVSSPASALLHSTPAAVPAKSQRRAPAVPGRVHRGNSSSLLPYLKPLVGGPTVLVHHLEFLGQSEQALRMSHKQIAVSVQAAVKLFDQPLL